MAEHTNNYPKLHNATWPGVVGKGSGRRRADHHARYAARSSPARPSTRARSSTASISGSPIRTSRSTASRDDIKRVIDHISGYGFKVGSYVAPIWGGAGGGSAMGDADERKRFLSAGRKACAIGKQMRECGIRPSGWRPHRLLDRRRGLGQGPGWQHQEIAETFREAGKIAMDYGEISSPKARSAGAACIPGART